MATSELVFEDVLDSITKEEEIAPWEPEMHFQKCYVLDTNTNLTKIVPEPINMFDLLGENVKVYFDYLKYSKPEDLEMLTRDIKYACNLQGFTVARNGSNFQKDGKTQNELELFRFRCSHGRAYAGKKRPGNDPRNEVDGRKRTIIADSNNTRKGGKNMPRLTKTTQNGIICKFQFNITFDGKGFVLRNLKEEHCKHEGHRKLNSNEVTMTKAAVPDKMIERMLQDAGVAMSIAGTQRVLNMMDNQEGPFVGRELVRDFRSNHMLKSNVCGTVVDPTNKDEIDIVLELLKLNKAKVAYLSVKPLLDLKDVHKPVITSTSPYAKVENDIIEYVNGRTFVVRTSSQILGIGIKVQGEGYGYPTITSINHTSDLFGLVKIGDQIMSVNGTSVQGYSINAFKDILFKMKHEQKTLQVLKQISIPEKEIDEEKSIVETQLCTNMQYKNGCGKIFTEDMYAELEQIANEYRGKHCDKNRHLEIFLSIAWVDRFSHAIAMMNSNCVMVDTTFNVCKFSNFRQFSVCVKGTNGKVWTVARIGVPHEKRAVLAYVIEWVIPSLLTELFPRRVRALICDGCPHLCGAIDRSIQSVFVNAVRLRCTYHIITRSWINNMENRITYHEFVPQDIKEQFEKFVQGWLYSFARSTLFTKEEYELSKKMLLIWLVSDEVVNNVCTKESAAKIVNWITDTILPYESSFAFYRRKSLFNMDNSTTCPVEATHRALKNNSFAVSRNDSLSTYVKKATDYDANRARNMHATVAKSIHSKNLFGFEYMNGLNDRGAKLQYDTIQFSENYASRFLRYQDGLPIFALICHSLEDEDVHIIGENPVKVSSSSVQESVSKRKKKYKEYTYQLPKRHPKFRHVWKVWLRFKKDGEYELVCTCELFSRNGLCCTHCHHVYFYHLKPHDLFEDFTFDSFKVQWWKVSEYLVHKDPTKLTENEKKILEKLLFLADEDDRVGFTLKSKRKDLDSAILKCNWSTDVCRGNKVTEESLIDPNTFLDKNAQERLIGWKYNMDDSLVGFPMVPHSNVLDFSRNDGENDIAVPYTPKVRKQEECRKELLNLLYDTCSMIHLPDNPSFFNDLKSSLEKHHKEAVQLVLNKEDNPQTPDGGRIFAGVIGEGETTTKVHAYSSPKKRKKRKVNKNNLSSP